VVLYGGLGAEILDDDLANIFRSSTPWDECDQLSEYMGLGLIPETERGRPNRRGHDALWKIHMHWAIMAMLNEFLLTIICDWYMFFIKNIQNYINERSGFHE
jgi:hypothetical protein